MRDGCPFCDYEGPSKVLYEGTYVIHGTPRGYFVIEPMEPVTPGHLLVIPCDHEPDFRRFPRLFGALMTVAAFHAGVDPAEGCNVIASAGEHSTLTVPHMHVHVLPRRAGDGLRIPWGRLAHEHEPKPQPGTPEFDSWVKREESVR